MLGKLNLVTILGALALFFFPWIEVQCSGKPMFRQTGVQTIQGTGTLLGEFREYENQENSEGKAAVLPAIALFCIVGALAFAIRSFLKGGGHDIPGALCFIALIFLLIQAAVEFPARETEGIHRSAPRSPGPLGGIQETINEATRREITSNYLPAFYLELAALAFPSLVFVNGAISRLRKQGAVV